jgi:hypothetical protein
VNPVDALIVAVGVLLSALVFVVLAIAVIEAIDERAGWK